METRRKIIIDTDIGDDIDDAFAILLAVLSEKFEILGVTTVFRNSLHRGRLPRQLLESAGADVPVYAGADEPIDGKIPTFPFEDTDADGKPAIPHYFPKWRKRGRKRRLRKILFSIWRTYIRRKYPSSPSLPLPILQKRRKSAPTVFERSRKFF